MAGVRPLSSESRSGQPGQHKLSDLLLAEEKAHLTQWLGSDTSVAASGVCQLLASGAGQWTILGTGVVCIVKDFSRRIYCIQFFDVAGQLLLEQRLYHSFLTHSKPSFEKLLQFEGDHCVYGLNFADTSEARLFKSTLQKYDQRRQNQLKNAPALAPPVTPEPTLYQPLDPGTLRKNKRKKKLTRSDIGLPQQFRHLSHFDISPEKSFVKDSARTVPKLDPRICNLLESIGERVDKLDTDEQEFICNFIEQQGGVGNLEKEIQKGGTVGRRRSPLPFDQIVPPPTTAAPTPPPKEYFHVTIPRAKLAGTPPPPPAPMSTFGSPKDAIPAQPTAPPPPPPPPGPAMGMEQASPKMHESLPGDLMAQIVQGKQLRPVAATDTAPKSATVGRASGEGIALALAKALAERRQHMKPDEEASENEVDDLSDSDDGEWV